MGNEPPKPVAKTPTLQEQIMSLRMQAKRFDFESKKNLKDKEANIKKAKLALQKGDEAGAQLFAQQANSKEMEYRKNIQLSNRLEAMAGAINQNNGSIEQMKALSMVTPMIESQSQTMNIDHIMKTLEQFDRANNELDVTGKMMGDVMNKQFVGPSSNEQTDKIMQELKGEIALDNMNQMGIGGLEKIELPAQKQADPSVDFYAGLKKIN